MAMATRECSVTYKPISCIKTSLQRGRLRFDPENGPTVKLWRCELTALSQAYNLYFVACNFEVLVYQPRFPNQSLSGAPALIIMVPDLGLGNRPGIDLDDPHSVTRLHIDYLGNSEILLLACDDGDVVGYRVSDIHHLAGNKQDSLRPIIRPILHINVGSSAWGLAVHRQARLIAISANSHQIRVIAYGLSKPDESRDFDEMSDNTYDFPFSRHYNHFIVLQGHTNIPFVSFDNSGGDPAGRWLFSSSIDGINHLWDLSNPQQPAIFTAVGYCLHDTTRWATISPLPPCHCPDRASVPHAAWASMSIDSRACHLASSLDEACPRVDNPGGPNFWDITELVPRFMTKREFPPHAMHAALASLWNEEWVTLDIDDTESQGSDPMSIDNGMVPDAVQPDTTVADTASETEQIAPGDDEHGTQSEDEESLFVASPVRPSVWVPYCKSVAVATPDTQRTQSEVPDESSSPGTMSQSLPQREPLSQRACLIVTKEEIYMVNLSRSGVTYPVIMMRNPLYPPLENEDIYISPYHRQCYVTQVPELGIFIVASPAGRVGIFRLMKYVHEGQTIHSFRLDHLLPTTQDGKYIIEEWGKRLVGVAVGPVQGMLDRSQDDEDGDAVADGEREAGRRWRLIIYYHDHTVESYELGKYTGETELRLGNLDV